MSFGVIRVSLRVIRGVLQSREIRWGQLAISKN